MHRTPVSRWPQISLLLETCAICQRAWPAHQPGPCSRRCTQKLALVDQSLQSSPWVIASKHIEMRSFPPFPRFGSGQPGGHWPLELACHYQQAALTPRHTVVVLATRGGQPRTISVHHSGPRASVQAPVSPEVILKLVFHMRGHEWT